MDIHNLLLSHNFISTKYIFKSICQNSNNLVTFNKVSLIYHYISMEKDFQKRKGEHLFPLFYFGIFYYYCTFCNLLHKTTSN